MGFSRQEDWSLNTLELIHPHVPKDMAIVLILILEGLTQAPGFRQFLSFT